LFDLVVRGDTGEEAYIEIKVDGGWSPDQMNNQFRYLTERPSAAGKLILLSNSACKLPRVEIEKLGGGRFVKISYAELYRALDAINGSEELCEFVAAYKAALQQQEARVRTQRALNPND
jgi:hypothetical protein